MEEEERMWKRNEIGPVFIPLEMGGLTPRINLSDWSGKTRLVGTDLRARPLIGLSKTRLVRTNFRLALIGQHQNKP